MKFLIETPTIGFVETSASDIDLIIEIENQFENNQFINPYTKERHLQVITNRDEMHLLIWNKIEKQIIGFIILGGLENLNLSLEFRRIIIQPKGKGFGKQSLRLIKNYCFQQLKFHRLWLDVFDDNQVAIKFYLSEKFTQEGQLRDVVKYGNSYRSLLIFSILEKEFYND